MQVEGPKFREDCSRSPRLLSVHSVRSPRLPRLIAFTSMNTAFTRELERLVVAQGECGAVFFLAQELEFIKISYEQVCTSFETVDSPAVDVLAELLSRQGDIRSSRAHVSG